MVFLKKKDFKRLFKQFKKLLFKQNEEFLDYKRDQEESIIERILDKQMEAYFATMFEDVRHERSLILLLSSTDPDILKHSKLTYHEMKILKKLALEKLHRQRKLKKYVAVQLLEKYFLFIK